jgi:hypothetical protein
MTSKKTKLDSQHNCRVRVTLCPNFLRYTIALDCATCGLETVETIRLTVDAAEAWKLLQNRYEGKGNFVLTKGFDDWHALSLDPEDIAAFNIRFKNINSQLSGAGLDVPPVMSMLHYLNVVQATFPNWADKYRGKMRKYQPGNMPTIKKLDDLMDRLLEESCAHTVANDRAVALYRNQPPKRGGYTKRGGGRGGGRGAAQQASSQTHGWAGTYIFVCVETTALVAFRNVE